MPATRTLHFETAQQVIDDVTHLRAAGYSKSGSWSLPQICWHLHATTSFIMRPGPHPEPTPEQLANRARLHSILSTNQLPAGIQAPDAVTPPPDAPDSAVDDFLATLDRLQSFPGPFAPHRLFGRLSNDEARRLVLIHSAHHLSHLVPHQGSPVPTGN
jgi:hypothetical protein